VPDLGQDITWGLLVIAMVNGAKKRSFHALNDFFLAEALFKLHPLFPFTD